METFIPIQPFAPNPDFSAQRDAALAGLERAEIDPPLAGIVRALNRMPHCFTLQCCCGHFVLPGQEDERRLATLPARFEGVEQVEWRIAYVALCLEHSPAGRGLLGQLGRICKLDPGNIQVGSARWFWERQVNTFVLQVEPQRFQHLDRVWLPWDQARAVQKARDLWLQGLTELAGAAQD